MCRAISALLSRIAESLRRQFRPGLVVLFPRGEPRFEAIHVRDQASCAISSNMAGVSCVLEIKTVETAGLCHVYDLMRQEKLIGGL
jgi:hypothetical protein